LQKIIPQKITETGIVGNARQLQSRSKPSTPHRVDFRRIKSAASFERVLAYYGIALIGGRGAQRTALCPFHPDTRPSLNVNLDKKVFNCFPCGEGGDIVKFVAKKEHPTNSEGYLVEAVKKLAEICGIYIDDERIKPPTKPAQRSRGAINPALAFELRVDPKHPYLAERGLSLETIDTFGLGYCVSQKSMVRERIVIPIHNERGELVAYAGRWPGDSGWPEGTGKYTLPPKFQKSSVLFNLNRVIEGMGRSQWPGHEDHVVVVEGYFGVFAIHPLAPCVALMGCSLSTGQRDLLVRAKIRFVTLLLDGPRNGLTADKPRKWKDLIWATVDNLLGHGFFVRSVELGIGEQPDTISRDCLAGLVSF
jgi:DNA primase